MRLEFQQNNNNNVKFLQRIWEHTSVGLNETNSSLASWNRSDHDNDLQRAIDLPDLRWDLS